MARKRRTKAEILAAQSEGLGDTVEKVLEGMIKRIGKELTTTTIDNITQFNEFYQLDIEMSFVEQEDVFQVVEPLLHEVFTKFSKGYSISTLFPYTTLFRDRKSVV